MKPRCSVPRCAAVFHRLTGRPTRGPGVLGLLVLAAFLGLDPRSIAAQTNDLSLADSFPPSSLVSLLIAPESWHPYPAFADRAGWEKLPAAARDLLIRHGEAARAKPLPDLPATLYLAYARDGDRGRFEGPYFQRRRRLHELVVAECVEGKHRFLDAIADNLWSICEESTWCVPAHVGAQKSGVGLPDVDEPVVDLFAAQTGSSVAWTLYLVGTELDSVSPRLRRRARAEVDRRILTPYLGRDYGWMGFNSRKPEDRPNNWNPWINGNVLTAALLLETDTQRRVSIVHRALRSLDRFLQPYPSDGGCDEGPGYWSRAGGSVLDNLDLLFDATAGKLDVFGNPLIQEIGRFIHRVHIAGDWYVDIGDCTARPGLDRSVVFRYGQRIHDRPLEDLACHGVTLENLVGEVAGIDLGRALRALADLEPMLARAQSPAPLVRDAWLGSDDLQMMVARDRAGTTNGLFVAAWGGHNAQSHNHNDVGNFMLFADGQPVFIDLGAPTYTAKTFSSRRYEIPAMQSAWHNLPTLNGIMQAAGRRFAADHVRYESGEAFAELTMDLARAWPAEAHVASWQRTVRLDRGSEVRLVESFRLESLTSGPVLGLITPCEPASKADGRWELPLPRRDPGQSRAVTVLFDPAKLKVLVEPVPIDDSRLAGVWGPTLRRMLFSPRIPAAKDTWTLRFRLEP